MWSRIQEGFSVLWKHFWASFLVVFLAELGDKTQLIVMAFAVKYNWKSVFLGMTLGIFVVHSLAVAIGSLAGELIPVHLMTIIASCLFIGFGVWTLRGDDEGEDEDEATKSSRFGPLLTVAMTFIIGEMGDKTQFAAMTMATQYESWWLVLCGAVPRSGESSGGGLAPHHWHFSHPVFVMTGLRITEVPFVKYRTIELFTCQGTYGRFLNFDGRKHPSTW